jgi:transposase
MQLLLYAGIDLHAKNNYLGIIDGQDRRILEKKLPNDLDTIFCCLNPFKEDIAGVVVESTFNWYWLVDGLMEHGYSVHLANPSAIKQYEGLKYTDDKWDSFWLAHMLRLNILPEGYIYPAKERPLRDLLRKRLKLVREKTSHILSLKSMFSRNLGIAITSNSIDILEKEYVERNLTEPHLMMAAQASISIMKTLKKHIQIIEKEVMSKISLRKPFQCLLSVPGTGNILALTIMLEVGDISRFKQVGDYSSYCRCVRTQRISNGKNKGKGNTKNGNKYLAWAYIEAANYAKRYCPYARAFYQRKANQGGNALAIKALANKLSRATYYIMRDNIEYDPKMLFG